MQGSAGSCFISAVINITQAIPHSLSLLILSRWYTIIMIILFILLPFSGPNIWNDLLLGFIDLYYHDFFFFLLFFLWPTKQSIVYISLDGHYHTTVVKQSSRCHFVKLWNCCPRCLESSVISDFCKFAAMLRWCEIANQFSTFIKKTSFESLEICYFAPPYAARTLWRHQCHCLYFKIGMLCNLWHGKCKSIVHSKNVCFFC